MTKTITFSAKLVVSLAMLLLSSVASALPTPTTKWQDLNIIDTVNVYLQMTETEGDWVGVNVNPLLEKTGVDLAEAQANVGDIIYIWQLDKSGEKEDVYIDDNLWSLSTWGYWWFDFATEEKDIFAASAWSESCFGWTGGNSEIDGEGTYWVFFGPYGGARIGQIAHTQMYAIIGNDAILVNIDVEIVGATLRTLDECTLRGEMNVFTNNQVSNGWNGRTARFDLQQVLDSLGCGTQDIQFYALDSLGYLNPNFTANAGYWMTMDGAIADYNDGAKLWFAELNTSNSSFNVGHMPGMFTGDGSEVCYGTFYIGFYDLIYQINLNMTVIPDRELPTEFVEVGSEELYLQAEANYDNWSCGYDVNLDYERACRLTECVQGDELVFYAQTEEGAWIKTTTVTTPDGFWLTPEGYHTWYGTNSVFFIENCNRGHIGNWGHYAGNDEAGTSYTGKFYLMNEANGKYYTINYRCDFVTEVVEKEVVGSEDITVISGSLEDAYTKIDSEKLLAALGVEGTEIPEELLWLTSGFGGHYDDSKAEGIGYYFDAENKVLDPNVIEELESAMFYITYSKDEGYDSFMSHEVLEIPADASYSVKIAAEYNNKLYIYNITVVSDTATSISKVESQNSSSKAYNLLGMPVNGNYHGVVIKDNKKVLR